MNKVFLLLFVFALIIISCSEQNNKSETSGKTLQHQWLDSIIKQSDSSYSKPYKRTDFVNAVFYVNKKDSSVCQVMKDSAGSIRQIIIARKNVRTFFAQYFANGNLEADLPLDEFGQYHGKAVFYFDNGKIQSTGSFSHGLKTGEWKTFNEKGKLLYSDQYDSNGQAIPQQHQ